MTAENDKLVREIIIELYGKPPHENPVKCQCILCIDWMIPIEKPEIALKRMAEEKDKENKQIEQFLSDMQKALIEFWDENEKLKADLKENQQISDRISSLIMERDEFKAENEKLRDVMIEQGLDYQLEEAKAEGYDKALEEAKDIMFSYLTQKQHERFCKGLDKLKQEATKK